jgi:hypothetical protein
VGFLGVAVLFLLTSGVIIHRKVVAELSRQHRATARHAQAERC